MNFNDLELDFQCEFLCFTKFFSVWFFLNNIFNKGFASEGLSHLAHGNSCQNEKLL